YSPTTDLVLRVPTHQTGRRRLPLCIFLLTDTAPTEIYTLSLHDALPILERGNARLGDVEVLVLDEADHMFDMGFLPSVRRIVGLDRKSTRLNSSHVKISYAVFCLKKKNTTTDRDDSVTHR